MNIVKAAFFVFAAASTALGGMQKTSHLSRTKTGIVFGDGSSVYVRTVNITAVSKQIYFLSGFKITEMVVDIATSPSQIKIYNIQTPSPAEATETAAGAAGAAAEAAQKSAGITSPDFDYQKAAQQLESAKKSIGLESASAPRANVPTKISKLFPSSTHSKTLEFFVADIDDMEKLYDAFSRDFITQDERLEGACYTITPKK